MRKSDVRKSQWADGNLEFEVVDSGSIATAPDSSLVIAARDLGSKNITAFANVELEILIFDSALSNSEVYAIQGYLAHKWGLTDAMPNSTPSSQYYPPLKIDPRFCSVASPSIKIKMYLYH